MPFLSNEKYFFKPPLQGQISLYNHVKNTNSKMGKSYFRIKETFSIDCPLLPLT
jgi:hypothetical protein